MILLIDDDTPFVHSLERFLRYTGLEAVSICTGTEALAMLHARKPTLIILDIHMPVLDGMTMLRAIRKDPTFRNVPILVLTSDISGKLEVDALAAGAQDFLVKGTIGSAGLLERIHDLLGTPKAAPRSPDTDSSLP